MAPVPSACFAAWNPNPSAPLNKLHDVSMSYEQLDYEGAATTLPAEVAAFIEEADRRYDAYQDAGLHKRYPKYVPSEPAQVYAALKNDTDQGLPLVDYFIEWGSGFGVATGLAALLGYTATASSYRRIWSKKPGSLSTRKSRPIHRLQLYPRWLYPI